MECLCNLYNIMRNKIDYDIFHFQFGCNNNACAFLFPLRYFGQKIYPINKVKQ